MTTALDVNPAVADFASAVRRSLSDLGADVVDELTDGLEADLADKLHDGAELGDPAAYAAELRAAAGLEAPRRLNLGDWVRADLAHSRARLAPLRSHPVVVEVVAFFVSLRPVWWVLRGLAVFSAFNEFTAVPQNPWGYPVVIALLVTSVQWGRGRWLPWAWSRGAVVVISVVAVLLTPLLMSNLASRLAPYQPSAVAETAPNGVYLDGEEVTNIFAYGADGKPLTDVQLFDQSGNPLQVIPDAWNMQWVWADEGMTRALVPSDAVGGKSGWNVYPLESVAPMGLDDYQIGVDAGARRSPAIPPFDSVQQLLGYEPPVEEPAAEPAPAE